MGESNFFSTNSLLNINHEDRRDPVSQKPNYVKKIQKLCEAFVGSPLLQEEYREYFTTRIGLTNDFFDCFRDPRVAKFAEALAAQAGTLYDKFFKLDTSQTMLHGDYHILNRLYKQEKARKGEAERPPSGTSLWLVSR